MKQNLPTFIAALLILGKKSIAFYLCGVAEGSPIVLQGFFQFSKKAFRG